jgi:hypothetical protein
MKRPNFNYGRFNKQHQPAPPPTGGRGEEVLRSLKGTLTARNKRMKVTLARRKDKDADSI